MWPNPQETAGLEIFTEKILNGKLHFLCTSKVLKGYNYVSLTLPKAELKLDKNGVSGALFNDT